MTHIYSKYTSASNIILNANNTIIIVHSSNIIYIQRYKIQIYKI